MVRTIISLPADDKRWLEQRARAGGMSTSALVRKVVAGLRVSEPATFDQLLADTRGTWKHGDGLRYQRKARSQWR